MVPQNINEIQQLVSDGPTEHQWNTATGKATLKGKTGQMFHDNVKMLG